MFRAKEELARFHESVKNLEWYNLWTRYKYVKSLFCKSMQKLKQKNLEIAELQLRISALELDKQDLLSNIEHLKTYLEINGLSTRSMNEFYNNSFDCEE